MRLKYNRFCKCAARIHCKSHLCSTFSSLDAVRMSSLCVCLLASWSQGIVVLYAETYRPTLNTEQKLLTACFDNIRSIGLQDCTSWKCGSAETKTKTDRKSTYLRHLTTIAITIASRISRTTPQTAATIATNSVQL